jgi:hypothetical protein
VYSKFLVDKLEPLTQSSLEVVLPVGEEHQYKDFDKMRWVPIYQRMVNGLADELERMEFTKLDVEKSHWVGHI